MNSEESIRASAAVEVVTLETEDPDLWPFGVIGFDDNCAIQVYNQVESLAAGLSSDRTLGRHLFDVVAPCMNNFLVAQRFHDAADLEQALDITIDYVLTLRMKPTPVRLRLISDPTLQYRYILVSRKTQNVGRSEGQVAPPDIASDCVTDSARATLDR